MADAFYKGPKRVEALNTTGAFLVARPLPSSVRAVAINVGANTNEPGFRAPVRPDGRFEYVPIPESLPTSDPVPAYGDLELDCVPADLLDVPVHLDPEFPEYPRCERYTYGDEHGVKAGPLSELSAGDYLLFYATLSPAGVAEELPEWQASDWGAYLIGHFRVARVVTGETYCDIPPAQRAPFRNNAHVNRETFDARVLVLGDSHGSRLYDQAVPLSGRESGVTPNRVVTSLSNDSGKGPWWRRPLRFNGDAADELLQVVEEGAVERCFEG